MNHDDPLLDFRAVAPSVFALQPKRAPARFCALGVYLFRGARFLLEARVRPRMESLPALSPINPATYDSGTEHDAL